MSPTYESSANEIRDFEAHLYPFPQLLYSSTAVKFKEGRDNDERRDTPYWNDPEN